MSMNALCLSLAAVLMQAPEPGPKSPAESLATLRPRPGFTVELMAAEPLVMDPVAIAFGVDGKLWVVEMGDYPLGLDGEGKRGGKIKYLEKSKSDGPYDQATLFLDGLPFPTGVLPLADGILVTCAPDILFVPILPDGKAGPNQTLFTGFHEGNQQHRVNGLVWGIDNWIYGANGDSGGVIETPRAKVDIRGRDFRLKVSPPEFEAVSGQSQFGRATDDFGEWFGNNNTNPMFHYVLDDRLLRRNPHVAAPDPRTAVPVKPGSSPVYPISPPMPRYNTPTALNHFTSACGTILYRDTLFGKDFEGNMFVSEPVHNLVHREIMSPKGYTFSSRRADDEQTSEFLVSSDNWFRPAMIQVGPDGALWVVDMYRHVIEHPQWIPKDWQAKLDLRAGHDRGRIYRVFPKDVKPREMPRLDRMTTAELVKSLASPSGWIRDHAQQLLIRRDDVDKARTELTRMTTSHPMPQARLHAAYVLASLPNPPGFARMLDDPHPGVRKQAIARCGEAKSPEIEAKLPNLIRDPDAGCRLQTAYHLGEFPGGAKLLATFLRESASDPYLSAAALSSIRRDNFPAILDACLNDPGLPTSTLVPLVRLAKEYGQPGDVGRLLATRLASGKLEPPARRLTTAAEVIASLEANNGPATMIVAGLPKDVAGELRSLHELATSLSQNPDAPIGDRLAAVRLLARGLGDDAADRRRLGSLLAPQTPDSLGAAAIQQIKGDADRSAAQVLVDHWQGLSPSLREQAIDALVSRPEWIHVLFNALRSKVARVNEIDAVRRQRLLTHRDSAIRATAERVFAIPTSDRAKLVADVASRLPAPDAERGAKLFLKTCAACHKLGSVGHGVGPDLAGVKDKSVEGLLTAILDPNRAVEARYVSYVATTKRGLTLTGVISGETSTSFSLTGSDGKTQTILRSDIEEIASTGRSLMPEGIERDLTPQDFADLIEHLRRATGETRK